MNFLLAFRSVVVREWHRALKDSNIVLVLLVAPLAYSALYGSIYLNKVEERVPIAVRDLDRSSTSRGLIRALNSLQNVSVQYSVFSEEEARELMVHERIHAVLIIPEHFARDLRRGKSTQTQLVISPGRLLVLGDVGFSVVECAARYGAGVKALYLARTGVPILQDPAYTQPISVDFRTMANPWLTYGDFILPALLAIILIQLALIAAAALTAREYSDRAWKELLSLTSYRLLPIMLGKPVITAGIMTAAALVLRYTLIPILDVRFAASLPDFLLLSFSAFLAASAMGLWLGTWFRNRVSVFAALGFTSYPFFMLSGYAWPSLQLPEFLRVFSSLLPTTPYLKGVLTMTQMGLPLSSHGWVILHFAALTALYLSLFGLRLRSLRRTLSTPLPSSEPSITSIVQ